MDEGQELQSAQDEVLDRAGGKAVSSQLAERWSASIREREIDAAVLRWCCASAPSVRSNDCSPAVEQGCPD